MQKPTRSEALRQSQMNEFKEKFLRLHELEEFLGEIFESEPRFSQKLPKKIQGSPKTIHHLENPSVISDDHI